MTQPASDPPLSALTPALEVARRTGYHEVRLLSDLDGTVAGAVRERLEELLEEGGTGRLVLDLAQCPFVDSAGLGALVAVYKQALSRGGPEAALVLLHPSAEIMDLLRMTHLDAYLPWFASLAEARARFGWLEG